MGRQKKRVEELEAGSEKEARPVAVEMAAEGLEELSTEEAQLRTQLEREVSQSFYRAGLALRKLRDRRLYRSTHGTFEQYGREILGFSVMRLYQLIGASEVYENLKNINNLFTLPSNEAQCRPLAQLNATEQVEVWQAAVDEAKGKAPPARQVLLLVLKLKERSGVPVPYHLDEVVRILVKENPELRGMNNHLAIVSEVGKFSVSIQSAVGEREQVHPQHLEPVPLAPEMEEEVRELIGRLRKLRSRFGEEPLVSHLLKYLATREELSPLSERLLEFLESEESDA